MRLSKFCFSLLIAICAFSGLYSEVRCKSHCKKIYIDKNSVEFCDGGIMVKMNKGFVTTKAVHFDEHGLYFLKSEAVRIKRLEYRCPGGCGAVCSSPGELAAHMKNCRYCKKR